MANEDGRNRTQVLHVEDHPVNAMLMAAIFEKRPQLELHIASTGEQALEMAVGLRPAFLLLDLNLPDCHGSDLLAWLRLVPGYALLPAIAVTADQDFEFRESGFLELWAKPLSVAHVLQRLDSLTRHSTGGHPVTRSMPQLFAQY